MNFIYVFLVVFFLILVVFFLIIVIVNKNLGDKGSKVSNMPALDDKDSKVSNMPALDDKDAESCNASFVYDADDAFKVQFNEKTKEKNPFENEEFKKYFDDYVALVEKKKRLHADTLYVHSELGRIVMCEEKFVNSVRATFEKKLNKKYATKSFQNVGDRINGIKYSKYLAFDFHELSLHDAKSFFKTVYTFCTNNEFDFQIIHGYKKGTAIKEFIEEVSVDNYKKLKDPHNKGVTMFLLEGRNKKDISKIIADYTVRYKVAVMKQCDEIEQKTQMLKITENTLKRKNVIENTKLFYYFLRTANKENYVKIRKIYDAFYTLDDLQKEFLMNLFLKETQKSVNVFVNKAFLVVLEYGHSYLNGWSLDEPFEHGELGEDFSVCIETKLLKKIIDILLIRGVPYRLSRILVLYSKLSDKQKQDLYLCICEENNEQLMTKKSSILESLKFFAISIQHRINESYCTWWSNDLLHTIEDIYFHKILIGDIDGAKRIRSFSVEQRKWYLLIKKGKKDFCQIPKKLLGEDFGVFLMNDLE